LNEAFPKKNLDRIDLLSFMHFDDLDDLSLKGVGLLNLNKIDQIFPNVSVLDFGGNKIF